MDKLKTDVYSPKNDDLLDKIVAAERQSQRLRKERYRDQLRKQMEYHSLQKQTTKLNIQNQLKSVYENIKKAEQTERAKRAERMKLQKNFHQANTKIMQRSTKPTTEPQLHGKSLLELLSDENQKLRQNRKEKLQMQSEMNVMQQQVKNKINQIKRQNEIRQRNEQLYEQQKHLQQMESFIEKRQRDKRSQFMRHQQNMRVYNEIGQLHQNQSKQAKELLDKFQNDHEGQARDEQIKHNHEKARKQKQIAWRNEVKNQLQEKKRQQQMMISEKKRDREILDRLAGPPQPFKDKYYLKELEAQIQQQKQKRMDQKSDRYGTVKQQGTWFSPGLLGKMPTSIERHKQLQIIDRRMGLNRSVDPTYYSPRNSMPQPSPPKAQILRQAREAREYHQLQKKLLSSRQNNANTMREQSHLGSREQIAPNSRGGQSIPLTERQQAGSSRGSNGVQQNISPRSQILSNSAVKSLKTYDFITGNNRIYNVAVGQQQN